MHSGPEMAERPRPRRDSALSRDQSSSTPESTPAINQTSERDVVYPKEGRDRVTVQFRSLDRLCEGGRFNDELVMFYIRWQRERFARAASSVSFFDSNFYTTLTGSTLQRRPKNGIAYESIKSWIKEDIFSRDYLAIPIHEDGHWYLAFVFNLSSIHVRRSKKSPSIVIIDSLGRLDSRPIHNLKKFLAAEARSRGYMATDGHFFVGWHARHAPKQSNFFDCGVYVCGWMEQILADPAGFVHVLSGEMKGVKWPKIDTMRIRNDIGAKLRKLEAEQTGEEKDDGIATLGYPILEQTKSGIPVLLRYRTISVEDTVDLVGTIQTIFESDPTVRNDGVVLLDAPHLISHPNDVILPTEGFAFEASAQCVSPKTGKARGFVQISDGHAASPPKKPAFEDTRNHSPDTFDQFFEETRKEAYAYFNIDLSSRSCRSQGSHKLSCGEPMNARSWIAGINTPFAYYSPGKSHFGLHVEDCHFPSYNILFAGQIKLWVVVKPSSRELLERKIREVFPKSGSCSQFVRHLGISISPSLLHAWGVKFLFVPQKPGQVIAVAGDAYHQGVNTGQNYAEAINFCMNRDGINDNDESYRDCYRGCGIKGKPLVKPGFEAGTMEEKVARHEERARAEEELWKPGTDPRKREREPEDFVANAKRARLMGDTGNRGVRGGKTEPCNYAYAFCRCTGKCDVYCRNRMTSIECHSGNCEVGLGCGNRPLAELKQRIKAGKLGVKKFQTTKIGSGVQSEEAFEKDQMVIEFLGKQMKRSDAERQVQDKTNIGCYFMQLSSKLVIDLKGSKSLGKFVNHSCAPNCRVEKWLVGHKTHLVLRANRAIKANEELTFNYNFELFMPCEPQACKCEAPTCPGFIGKSRISNENATSKSSFHRRRSPRSSPPPQRYADKSLDASVASADHARARKSRFTTPTLAKQPTGIGLTISGPYAKSLEAPPATSDQMLLRANQHLASQSSLVMNAYRPGLDELRAQVGTIAYQLTSRDRVSRMEELIRDANRDVGQYAAACSEIVNAEKQVVMSGLSHAERKGALKKFSKAGQLLERLQPTSRAVLDKERFHLEIKRLADWSFLSADAHVKTLGYAALNDLLALAKSNTAADGLSLLRRALYERMLDTDGKIIRVQGLTAGDVKRAKNRAFRRAEPPGDTYRGCTWVVYNEAGLPSLAASRYFGMKWPGAA